MDLTAVFAKTPKGVIEIKTRSAALTPAMRRVLIMTDGKRPLADLVPLVQQPHDVESLASALWEQGLIALADGSEALAPVDAEAESQVPALAAVNSDTTTAQRPAVLRLVPPTSQDLVERPGAGPPTLRDTIEGDLPLGRELSFAVAAAPRVAIPGDAIDTAARATDTSAAARPTTTLTRSRSMRHEAKHRDRAEFNEHAQVAASAAMGIASGFAPGTASAAADGSANGAASGIATATSRSNATHAVNGSDVAASIDVLLEESKRVAVRALYERLGPYGEAPAAKIRECTSLEALHEQVQQAVRRIADFRGEGAAREYLLMLARP